MTCLNISFTVNFKKKSFRDLCIQFEVKNHENIEQIDMRENQFGNGKST